MSGGEVGDRLADPQGVQLCEESLDLVGHRVGVGTRRVRLSSCPRGDDLLDETDVAVGGGA